MLANQDRVYRTLTYKLGNRISDESVYKQYTYARNVIQWNMNLFLNPTEQNKKWRDKTPKYRDDTTEGYNIVPNFFVSARMDEELSYDDKVYETNRENTSFIQKHFENRLFDRDTLLIYHYDVNFLYIVSLYAQNDDSAKEEWKNKVRGIFREKIQEMLQSQFAFYAMTSHPNVDASKYIKENFKDVLGKMYQPFPNKEFFSLALDTDDKYKEENRKLITELEKHFYVEKCAIGTDPTEMLESAKATKVIAVKPKKKNGVLMIMMENYNGKSRQFINDGTLAIGIKDTDFGAGIVENISSIGYVLFHTRSDEAHKHLFPVHNTQLVDESMVKDMGIYNTPQHLKEYVLLKMDTDFELMSNTLFVKQIPYTSTTRYDAQFVWLEELKKNEI